jgi:hypothetical protein
VGSWPIKNWAGGAQGLAAITKSLLLVDRQLSLTMIQKLRVD